MVTNINETTTVGELLDECSTNRTHIDGVVILGSRQNKKQPPKDWTYVNNTSKRVMVNIKRIPQLAGLNSSVMEMQPSSDGVLKEFLKDKLRVRTSQNPYFKLATKSKPPENFVIGMLVPVEVIDFNVRGRIETFTELYMVFLSEDGTLEYRYKVVNETIVPGKKLTARCVKQSNRKGPKDICLCNSVIEFSIPFGTNIDDLYYTEFICSLQHGVHGRADCARPKKTQIRKGQVNVDESASEWQKNKDACINKRNRMARKIYSAYRHRNGF